MHVFVLIAALWASICLWIHTVLGHHRVHLKIQASDAPRFAKATMWACWHVVTGILAFMTLGLYYAALFTELRDAVIILAASLTLAFSAIFVLVGWRVYRKPFIMPQIYLLAPIGLLSALSLQSLEVMDGPQFVIWSLCIVLSLLSVLHLYWAFGGSWPAKSRAELTELVVGTSGTKSKFPSRTATIGVSLCLALMAALPFLSFDKIYVWVVYGLTALFAVRGVGGFLEYRFRPSAQELPYGKYNRLLYSPLSLAVACLWFALGQFT